MPSNLQVSKKTLLTHVQHVNAFNSIYNTLKAYIPSMDGTSGNRCPMSGNVNAMLYIYLKYQAIILAGCEMMKNDLIVSSNPSTSGEDHCPFKKKNAI